MSAIGIDIIVVVLLLAGFFVGWNIGANDAANCIGTTVGAGIISFRKAVVLMAIFVTLGAVLQGHHVMKTVGGGIIITTVDAYEEKNNEPPPADFKNYFPEERLGDVAIFVALISAGFFVALATFSSIPVSTSQSIVGGVAGVGIGIVGFQGGYFQLKVLTKILGCWVISPVLTMIMGFVIYKILIHLLKKVKSVYRWEKVLGFLVIASACYVSYSLGANDVGNAIGPLLNKFPDSAQKLALFGGIALAVGGITFGRKVTEAVGKNITQLDLTAAFSAQLSGAMGVHLFSILGIPVSTSQAIVGAIIGVGLVKGAKSVSKKKIGQIVVGWVLAPTCAAAFAAILYVIISSFAGKLI